MTSLKKIEQIRLFHSERCPVCNGFGTVGSNNKTCHGCGGDGYVLVRSYSPQIEEEIHELIVRFLQKCLADLDKPTYV